MWHSPSTLAVLAAIHEMEQRMATKFDHLDAVTAALATAVAAVAADISTLTAALLDANARDDSADIETRANAIQAQVNLLAAALPPPPAPVVPPSDPAPVADPVAVAPVEPAPAAS